MENSYKYITISVAAFVCYCNTLWGSFVFDDTEAIVKNKDVTSYTPLRDVFGNDFWGTDITSNGSHKSYRPLTILSYRLNIIYSNNKLDAFQFHATNVILYGILCLLTVPIYELFLKKSKYATNIHDVAYYSSLLFTVHPVHTEAVAGLVGRADILSSVLFLLVLLVYQKYRNAHGEIVIFWFVTMVFLTCCAVLCKETAISVVGMLVIYDAYREKRRSNSWWEVFTFWNLVKYTTIISYGLVIMYYRFKVMNFEGPIFTNNDNPAAFSQHFSTRLFTYSYLYLVNFLLLLWPEWLCFDWSMGCIPLIESFCDIRLIFVILFWITIVYSTFALLKQNLQNNVLDARIMGVCLLLLPFLPASNLIFTVGFVIAERTLLLPSAGFCFLVVVGLKKLQRYYDNKKIFAIYFYLLLAVFTVRTVTRNSEWLTEERLFSSALAVCPLNAKVHYNIAKIAADKGQRSLAMEKYRRALELNPNYEQAMNNLANLLREDRRFKEAEVLLRKAVDVRPNFAAAWMNLGIVLTNLNRTDEAERCYITAIKHRNKYPDCYYNLGNLYLDLKRDSDALGAWERAVSYKPGHIAAWSNALVLLDNLGRFEEALRLGTAALKHNPNSAPLHFNMANTLGKIKSFERAEKHFLEAIRLVQLPNPMYYSNLGVLYHRWGKSDKAKEMYRRALEIDPNLKSASTNLKRLLTETIITNGQ